MYAAQCRASTLSLAAVAACLLASQGARAQRLVIAPVTDAPYARLGTEGEIAISGLDEMGAQLRLATPEQAQSLLIRLGVEPEIARGGAAQHDQLTAISLVSLPSLPPSATTPPATEYALLFLPQAVQGNAAMYLLSRSTQAGHTGVWHRADGGLVNQFSNPVSFELLTLRGRTAPLLALHHVNLSHGSNQCQDQTEVFTFSTGKLTQVLHTPDYVSSESLPSDERGLEEQRSTFLPLPDGTLEETRLTTADAQPVQLARRRWHWSATLAQFTPGAFQVLGTASAGALP